MPLLATSDGHRTPPMLKQFLKRRITAYLQDSLLAAATDRVTKDVATLLRRQQLLEAVLHSERPGVAKPDGGGTPVVVSLTTHGQRMHEVALAIESIMQGTVLPDAIVLWLDEDDVRPLPVTLQRQTRRGLQVRRTKDIRSYTKLLPALAAFPTAHIVTIDDDVFYPHDFLEMLLASYAAASETAAAPPIVANVVMQMTRDAEGVPQGIAQWPYLTAMPEHDDSRDLFFEGFGGVLYPAGCLGNEVFNKELFQRLCPTADDVWFNAQARLAEAPIRICQRAPYDFIAAVNPACQDTALNRINNATTSAPITPTSSLSTTPPSSLTPNDQQLRAVWQHYRLQGK